uniref:Protein kinase domain-containing protein n=1 Tax=Meloidogyne enterolobii TaxID=390850 RepID=A0A6V7WII6_MELEN|nr:unnamed protein product [Meloidogyne enterolobii]
MEEEGEMSADCLDTSETSTDSSKSLTSSSRSLMDTIESSIEIEASTTKSEECDKKIVQITNGGLIGNYKVVRRLGEGGCGVVYQVKANNKHYAMKVERLDMDKTDQLLGIEAHVLKRLQSSPYTVQFIQCGTCQSKGLGLRVLIMGLLGPSIDELRKQEIKGRFNMGTVLRIGFHALQAVAFVHCSYFVHRDIKPSNFAIGVNNSRRIYLFDFGLSRALKKRGDMELRTMREDVSFRGTSGYCSLNVHNRKEHGRHDDLWSIFYMLAELKTGDLPWMGRSRNKTKILKAKLMDFEYMHGCPVAFSTILNYLRTLDYHKRPDYIGIEQAFFGMMAAREVNWNQPLDWEVD